MTADASRRDRGPDGGGRGPGDGGAPDGGRGARGAPLARVLTREEVVAELGPGRDHVLVFTNGCFDLLHRGHVAYLNEAAALGERLLVALNGDASVRRLKGPGRPVLPAEDRAYLLASLRAVDHVTVFDEDTPAALIEALRPDVLVKGADYAPEQVVGREVVEASGGRVVLLELEEGRSTSALLGRIRTGRAADEGGRTGEGGPQGGGGEDRDKHEA